MTKRAIVRVAGGTFESQIIGKSVKPSIVVGQRVLVTGLIDFGPYGEVVSGDEGSVIVVDPELGEVVVEVVRHIRKMRPWGNSFSLMPFETDDALCCLVCIPTVTVELKVKLPEVKPMMPKCSWDPSRPNEVGAL